ncbi:hypothetical protein [Halopiger djelfimassiliensis]|uniref:hypothetical protein n=1 Tax=Halopiger djelfimassiliensis TaxID=1293047 RepID=UPI00067783BD|nr:hypothetical protein [Halopiger djelfimassiliensis]
MSRIREWLETARSERWGILTDLAFAIGWVTLVELVFRVLEGPTWAYYMFMVAGIAAYYGLIWSFKLAVARQERERR